MTEAGWTRDRPQVAGWYWYRPTTTIDPWPIFYEDEQVSDRLWTGPLSTFCKVGGEFLGPITPDSFQQGRVAGLREAENYALQCLKELQDKIRDLESGKRVLAGAQTKEGVEAWVHAKTLEANRIAKWITVRIIEQQAQGEKVVE